MKKRKGKKSMKLGGGGRFAKVEREAAVAEAPGRQKVGRLSDGPLRAGERGVHQSGAGRVAGRDQHAHHELVRQHRRDSSRERGRREGRKVVVVATFVTAAGTAFLPSVFVQERVHDP